MFYQKKKKWKLEKADEIEKEREVDTWTQIKWEM